MHRLPFAVTRNRLTESHPATLNYDYQQMSRTGPFVPQRGAYTHYGDVTPLLQRIDDEYVIFGTGEDMDLEFDAAAQPALPARWVRDYFFYANGFVKDMDFYEAFPFTVDTMPFHAMSGYPYQSKEHYPDDAKHIAYQLEWNDRFESGTAAHSYDVPLSANSVGSWRRRNKNSSMSHVVLRSAVEMLELLRARKISPRELAEEHIRQIERLNPRLNALIDFDADRVRAQAAALDGVRGAPGTLAGLPMSVKASISVAGHRCETGSLLNQGHTPATDAIIVSRMRQAGAVVLGTTNCPEFLMAYETDNRLYGRTSNPWDLERTAGGSSGGESAAIAAGLSAGGFGSDSGGSVREPAHFTGICALKPTPGRIPGDGHLPPCVGPFSLLGTIGPMARTIEDVSLLFRVLSGPADADPIGAPIPLQQHSMEDLQQVPIGFFEDDGLTPVTAETRQAVRSAVDSLRRQGFRVEPFRPHCP